MRWVCHWAPLESWLVGVDLVGRHTRSWSNIPGSTRNRENDGKSVNLGWMLYSVYAELSVNSRSWHGEIERDDSTLCSAIMAEKERWGMKMTQYGGYEQICNVRGTTCLIGFKSLCIGAFIRRIGSSTCHMRNGVSTRARNSFQSQFPMIISPISFHISLSLPSPNNTKLSHPYLSGDAMKMS